MAGGLVGDWLRARLPGSYFLVSGAGLLLSALRAVVPGRAVSLGLVHDLCGRLLHVRQHRTDECDPGQRGPPRDAAGRICLEHPGDSRAGRRDLAADHRRGVGLLEHSRSALPSSRHFWRPAACSGCGAGGISITIPRSRRSGCRSCAGPSQVDCLSAVSRCVWVFASQRLSPSLICSQNSSWGMPIPPRIRCRAASRIACSLGE